MNTEIQPKTKKINATCACGATYQFLSTLLEDIALEICSDSVTHFYTGKQKIVDTARRVEKFEKIQHVTQG